MAVLHTKWDETEDNYVFQDSWGTTWIPNFHFAYVPLRRKFDEFFKIDMQCARTMFFTYHKPLE